MILIQVGLRCVGELVLTILAVCTFYILYLAYLRTASIVEFIVEKVAWVASWTLVAYSIDWAVCMWTWCGPLWGLMAGPAIIPGIAAAQGTVMIAPQGCKIIAGAIAVFMSIFTCCKPR